ncbi:hypothetical protein HMPREF1022_02701 [Desulfovibrio sp. 6_1_46AFAA]|nr:hypothetical protein HMPREF1022_02701 [Desulfovibrio sp. 6_1_46AFAA]
MRCAVRAHYGRRSGPSGFLTTRRARRSKGKGGTPHGVPPCFMIENSPLSGEFQKGEAYSCQKEALLCYKKVVLTSVVAKESDNG